MSQDDHPTEPSATEQAQIEPAERRSSLTRREVIAAASTVGVAAALGIPERAVADTNRATARREARNRARAQAPAARPAAARSASARAAAVAPHGGDLGAVEHFVFLMLENRSYDHYFGAYHHGRGFDDHPNHSLRNFAQDYPAGTNLSPRKKLLPFHLAATAGQDCTHDLTHNWGPQHESWNRGKMDRWVKTHTESKYEGNPDGAMTMGYYTRRELPFHWALADHFTLADNYHCSILGPTHPNRVMSLTGTIDPAGRHGGPITDTNGDPSVLWSCDWTTVPELLEDKGVSWKVYHPSNVGVSGRYARLKDFPTWGPAFYDPDENPVVMALSDHVLPYFKAYKKQNTPLHRKAFHPTFPNDFVADCHSGKLPHVSWIIPPLGFDEHPSSEPTRGQWFTQEILHHLSKNKKQWAKTALFIMYDENDGWFDHVSPPTAPRGAHGEWLTAKHISSETNGIRGPLGLGVRVPMLIVSPFSRGGHIASNVFDHTSQLRLLEERFDIKVDNISPWRRRTVGSLHHALFKGRHDASMPALPKMALGPTLSSGNCASQDVEQGGASPTIPTHQRMPTQHGHTVPATRYFAETRTKSDRTPLHSGRNTATKKSGANPLAHGGEQVTPKAKRNR
jgi:phospholipase C